MPSATYLATSLAVSVALSASPAVGDLVTFTFAGHIDYLEGDLAFLGGSIPVGTSFSGSYTFDSATPDIRPANPGIGNYSGALTAFSVQIGPHAVIGNGASDEIIVWHMTEGEDAGDFYKVQDRTGQLVSRSVSTTLLLVDLGASAFADDALPLLPPPLILFSERTFQILDASPNAAFVLSGQITLLSPEPTSLVLVVGGGILLFGFRIRR